MEKIVVRLPDGLRGRIKQAAARNGRSANSELVFHLSRAYGCAPETAEVSLATSPAVSSNTTALAGGDIVNHGTGDTADDHSS